MITLDKILFDPANAADGASLGAYLRASDGTLLTHTDVGGKKALDVRLAEGVNVEVDLSHVDDSVKVGDGTDFLAVNADGSINAVVTATNLDIRDLAFATDKVDVGGSVVALDAGTLAALENITVSATDLDIRDLSHAQDSVKVGDGTDFLAINADGSINTTQASASSATYGATSVTTTATKIIATNLAGRRKVIVQNLGNKDMFFGHNSSVTAALGIRISAGSSAELEFGATLDLYAITSSGTASARYLEVA
jgi:hypothetical protein